jgi:uncharacterized protein (DUF2141 family)
MVVPMIGAAVALVSSPDLGTADAACRPHESGPSIVLQITGLKDRSGTLRAELYPDNDRDFLADDNLLIEQHKTFRRLIIQLPSSGAVWACLRAPAPGAYALVVIHDRDGDWKFSAVHDGVGFAGNPRLGWSRPPAASARIRVGMGPVETRIVMNYRHGLLSFGPLGEAR